MKKIVLLCSAGMSTSLLVSKMKKAAEKENFECSIQAFSSTEVLEHLDADCILLGPQIRFELKKLKGLVKCPIDAIDMRHYGMVDGEKVLQHAKALMEVE